MPQENIMTPYQKLKNCIDSKELTVGIIGMGYVGLPLLVEKAKAGLNVVGLDKNQDRINQLSKGISYIEDVPSEDLIQVQEKVDVCFTCDARQLKKADVIIICVPTPLDKNSCPDLSMVESACYDIMENVRPGQLISLESTTYPGTVEELMKPILEKSGLKIGEDIFLAYSPERVDPGNKHFNTKNTNKVVGADDSKSLELAVAFYKLALDTIITVNSSKTAEMVKVYENTFRAINIGLVNEMAQLCHEMDIDVWEMLTAAFTKPFGIMPFFPGPGVGGHCIPVDPHYLEWKAKEYGFHTSLIQAAAQINRSMPSFVINRVQELLNKQSLPMLNANILIVGVAYKANLGDYRQSPAMGVISLLQKAGCHIEYYDPYVKTFKLNGIKYDSIDLTEQNLKEQSLVLILTNHQGIDFQLINKYAANIFDTRNVYQPSERVVKL